MQIRYTKYIVMGAFMGAFLWYILSYLFYLSGLRSLDPISWMYYEARYAYPIPTLIAIVISTYVGLWSIGKIRKPSFLYGILSGLLSSVLILSWTILQGASFLFIVAGMIIGLAIVAGIIGVAIVRHISPSFCPNCGYKLPPGREPCPKCGTNP